MQSRAFTLIELLVVITIIVVLLALLTPALDRAIYQGELAVCAANQKAMANAAMVYAASYARHYPLPPQGRDGQPDFLGSTNSPQKDMRRLLIDTGLVTWKLLMDPLAGKIDITYDGNNDDTHVYMTYGIWFGMVWPGDVGMMRPSDRLEWTDPRWAGEGPVHSGFDILVADTNLVNDPRDGAAAAEVNIFTQSSHPDTGRRMSLEEFQMRQFGGTQVLDFRYGGGTYTASRWVGPVDRGLLDLNFTHTDCSVQRVNGVDTTVDRETRLRRALMAKGGGDLRWKLHVPGGG